MQQVADNLPRLSDLPVVSAECTRHLLTEVGLAEPQEIFRPLCYRCWVTACVQTRLHLETRPN
jgi:hypothetical protein